MPATHLISVDLPAPLSPTSAITCPASTWKSTSLRARTAPKLLSTPFSSSRCCPCSLNSLSRSFRGSPGRGAERPSPNCPSGRQRPADEQYFANFPTQIWLFVRNPSLITVSLMFDLVTATGVSNTDGVIWLPFLTLSVV